MFGLFAIFKMNSRQEYPSKLSFYNQKDNQIFFRTFSFSLSCGQKDFLSRLYYMGQIIVSKDSKVRNVCKDDGMVEMQQLVKAIK